MIDRIAPVGSAATLPQPVTAPPAPHPVAAASALGQMDRFEQFDPGQLKTDRQIKEFLAPVFNKLGQAGYGDTVAVLKKSRFRVTNGKFLNVEYYAATSSFNKIALSGKDFFDLGQPGMASVLLHESVHLRQSLLKRVGSTIISGWGKLPKLNFSEIEAYKVQWAAMDKLGLNDRGSDSVIYFTAQIALQDAGVLPK